jgi:hypothetical protein
VGQVARCRLDGGDDRGGDVAQLAVLSLGGLDEQPEGSVGSAAVAGHQDALGLLDHRLAGQGRVRVVDALLGLGEVGVPRTRFVVEALHGSFRLWGGIL